MGQGLMIGLIAVVVGLAAGAAAGYLYHDYRSRVMKETAKSQAERIVAGAETEARELILRAKDDVIRLRDEAEEEIKRRRQDLQRQEERLQQRRDDLDRRLEGVAVQERRLSQFQSKLDKRSNQLDKMEEERTAELERVASLTQAEAREMLLDSVREDARQDMARVIREVEAQAHDEAERRARKVVTLAIQRIASEQVAETTVSMVPLPSDDMKGRIIGRQGRNIRALENATGVDLVVDDTPEAVILSCFDPVRREIARVALTRLILDGRIHPARIEKVVEQSQAEVEQEIRSAGEEACIEAGVPGLHPELVKLLGRLKYRTSYGQNQLMHSIETAHLAGMMAQELGANAKVARLGALLHDIGKAVDHEVEGPHAVIGAELAKRYGMSAEVVNCIGAHHDEQEPESLEAILVEAADAISGARPGARRESLESYVKRVSALEGIANSFDGVAESYAIQAGREVRILVKPEDVDDLAAIQLSKNVAKAVEENLQYPGQIKVTVIRETRAVDYAK
jgi:ribonuclease Y